MCSASRAVEPAAHTGLQRDVLRQELRNSAELVPPRHTAVPGSVPSVQLVVAHRFPSIHLTSPQPRFADWRMKDHHRWTYI